jgi:type IV pilus assembly protein PilA
MIQKLRNRSRSESGFTLVELLVVMLILGLLAAIAIPSFFNQRDKARDADAKASVRTAETSMETYATDNQGSYAGATTPILEGIEATLTDAPSPVVISALSATGYTISVTSDAGQVFNIIRNANGTTDLTCTVAATDGCPVGGNWG